MNNTNPPVSFDQAVEEASKLSQRLNYLLPISDGMTGRTVVSVLQARAKSHDESVTLWPISGVAGEDANRYPGSNEDLVNAVRRSNLHPADYAAIHALLDSLGEGIDVFVLTDPDLVSAVRKLRGH